LDEGRWTSEAKLSALRRQVGAQHRTLSSYLNAFRGHRQMSQRCG
jgi:hypothetical protein